MSTKSSLKLQSALMATGLVQPVSEVTKGGHLEVLCRQVPGQEKPWLRVVEMLLTYGEGYSAAGVDLHICRRYLLKNGMMVFGWHIAIDCKNAKLLGTTVDNLVAEVLEEARTLLEAQEPAVTPAPREQPVAVQAASRAPLAPGQHPAPRMPPPRPPNAPGNVIGTVPPGFTPQIRVVQNTRDQNGKVTIVEEMQLPHVYTEMNIPNSKGRGAKLTGGG